jgi:hypothetical protein
VLVKAVNIGYSEEAPGIHGWRQMETVPGVNWGLGRVAHGIMTAEFSRVTNYSSLRIVNSSMLSG